jgi:hypothetical protein
MITVKLNSNPLAILCNHSFMFRKKPRQLLSCKGRNNFLTALQQKQLWNPYNIGHRLFGHINFRPALILIRHNCQYGMFNFHSLLVLNTVARSIPLGAMHRHGNTFYRPPPTSSPYMQTVSH